jgi:hypothetical protein
MIVGVSAAISTRSYISFCKMVSPTTTSRRISAMPSPSVSARMKMVRTFTLRLAASISSSPW